MICKPMQAFLLLKRNASLGLAVSKTKKTNGTQSLDGSLRKHVRNPKKNNFPSQKTKKNKKIKTNPLACFLGDPSRDSVPFVFLIFQFGPILDLFF